MKQCHRQTKSDPEAVECKPLCMIIWSCDYMYDYKQKFHCELNGVVIPTLLIKQQVVNEPKMLKKIKGGSLDS